jgi:hypothetical protein
MMTESSGQSGVLLQLALLLIVLKSTGSDGMGRSVVLFHVREGGEVMRISILRALPVLALFGVTAGFSQPAAHARLWVVVTCSGTQCTAGAGGGSGSYVDFEWSSAATELWEVGNSSGADASVSCAPGSMVPVDVFVTDSNGARALGGTWAFCP